jgi:glycosyltransferase involved in cell wall biosynthesis
MANGSHYTQSVSSKVPDDVELHLKRTVFAIPSINGAHLLRRMLITLNMPPETIVVLDQGSTDDTSKVCQEFGVNLKQLNDPHTYTECCNIALDIAKDQGADFLFISNNDIRFSTDVSRELLFEMLSDSLLGIVSCSQILIDENSGNTAHSNRVFWDLSAPLFEHDISPISAQTYRLESDFCELTCSLIRVSAAIEVGGFDNAYGFYHEDVDFGFRLREAGYTAAYLPQSQIEHFSGSTFRQGGDKRRLTYISRSKDIFTRKHLGLGVRYVDHKSSIMSSWTIINKNLYPYLERNGLLDNTRPELVFSHPGEHPFDYLYSVWETSRLPEDWRKFSENYRGVFLPSKWNLEVFRAEGFTNTHYVPLGVETDTFNAWGPTERWYDEPTYLWFARDQYRKGLDVMMRAWATFSKRCPGARLVVMGHGIANSKHFDKTRVRRWQNFLIYDDQESNISFREVIISISERELAQIYRSVDCVISTSRSEGFGFSVVEAMACGTLSIFPRYGATTDMEYENALSFDGQIVDADYSDKNFTDVGQWWEPNLEGVVAAMVIAYHMDPITRRLHARRAYNLVSGNFTWRNTVFHMRKALASDQERKILDWTQMSQPRFGLNEPQRSIVDILREPTPIVSLTSSPSLNPVISPSADGIDQIFLSFDQDYYFSVYSDIRNVASFALWHFVIHGCLEARQPSREFSCRQYLLANRDVRVFLGVFHNLLHTPYRGHIMRSFALWEERNLIRSVDKEVIRSDEDFVKLCYQILLRRSPDESGLTTFLHRAQSGQAGRVSVIESIATSSERQSLLF